MKTLLLWVLLATGAMAQTAPVFHVTVIHRATDTEKTYRTAFVQMLITGTIGTERVTVEQLKTWGAYHFQVGTDYPVVKLTDNTLKVRVTDKHGHESTESLNVVTVAE